MCSEMEKLRKKLDELNVEWKDHSEGRKGKKISGTDLLEFWMDRTRFTNVNGDEISVINGYGSYGGFDLCDNTDHGLLEVLNLNNYDQEGYLTAEEVIDQFYYCKEVVRD